MSKNVNVKAQVTGELVIDSKLGAQNTRHMSLQKGINCCINRFSVTREGSVIPSIIPMLENSALRNGWYNVKKSISVPCGAGFVRVTNKEKYAFTTDVFVFDFEDQKSMDAKIGKVYIKRGKRTKVVTVSGSDYEDILTGEEVQSSELFRENGSLKKGVEVYVFFGYSVSMLRGAQCYMINMTKGLQVIENMINDLTYGAYNIRKGDIVDIKGLIKFVARMFQWTAPSTNLGVIKAYSVLCGTFKDEEGNLFADGTSFGEDETYAEMLTIRNGAYYTAESVRGEMLQTRPFTAKQSTVMVSKRFIRRLLKQYTVVRYKRDEITDEINKMIADGRNGVGPLAGKMVIIGEGDPFLVMDSNGIKTEYDFGRKGTFDVLAIGKSSKTRTSRQMLQKLMFKDEKAAMFLIKDLFIKQFSLEITDALVDRKPSIPPFNAFDKVYLQNVAASVAPKYVIENDRAMFKGIAEATIKRMAKSIDRFNLSIDGFNGRVLPDIAKLFGLKNILKFNQVFCKAAERYFKAKKSQSRRFWMVKYPTIGNRELHAGEVTFLSEVKRTIKAMKLDKELEEILIEFYSSLSDSIIVVAAIEELKNLLAGMDFDMDGASMMLDEESNDIIHKDYRFFIVKIVESKKKEVKNAEKSELSVTIDFSKNKAYGERRYVIAIENFVFAFLEQIRNGNESVGRVTNMAEILKALARYPEVAREMLRKVYKEGNGETFHGIELNEIVIDGQVGDIVYVSEETIDRVLAEIETVKFTDENIAKIFFDFDIIFRFYQESIIDAAKSGKKVVIKIIIAKMIWALSLTKINVDKIDWDNKKFLYSLDDSVNSKKETFPDLFYKLKLRLFQIAQKTIEEDIMSSDQKFSSEQLAVFQKYDAKRYRDLTKSIEGLKLVYNDITGGYISAVTDAKTDDVKKAVKDAYKDEIAMMASFGRELTKDFSPIERARVAKYVSLINNNGIRDDGGSQFASTVFPEEYLLMLDKEFSEIHFAGSKLLVNKGYKDGDVVEFKHGLSKNAIFEGDYSGAMTIREFNGSLYATKDIKDLVVIPNTQNIVPIKLKDGTIVGREEEVKELLNEAEEIYISAKSDKDGNDFGIYIVKNDTVVKVAGIDTRGKLYNSAINGMKAKIAKLGVHTVKDLRTSKPKTSIVLYAKDLVEATVDTSSFAENAEESFEIGEIIDSNEL